MRWFGAERVRGLPILDPPAVQNRNLHQREHAFLYSARLREAVSLATGRFLGARARAQVQHAASIFFGVAAALPRASRRPISGASALFFALNTALRNKALRARSFFVKRQFGQRERCVQQQRAFSEGKASVTKIVSAFEHSLAGSAQEKCNSAVTWKQW